MANVKLIIGILLSAVIVVFIVQNVTVVNIRFLAWTFEMSRVLMMFILFVGGIITGWIMHEFWVCKPYQNKLRQEKTAHEVMETQDIEESSEEA
ncbi:MAG: LapA family protein [Caldisericia bacterium]|nr:LapA family protein [Caldisericia bacterium]MDD4614893.1 LapA family protein [Caldisericia bacterium]